MNFDKTTLLIEPNFTYPVLPTKIFTRAISDLLSVDHPGKRFIKSYRDKKWDGKIDLYNADERCFPTGLLHLVLQHETLSQLVDPVYNFTYTPVEPNLELKGIELTPIQKECLETCLEHKRGIVKLPTGEGKTEIYIALINTLRKKTLIVVPTKMLFYQTKKRIVARIPHLESYIGLLGDSHKETDTITIAIANSMEILYEQDPKFLNTYECIILDECHSATSKMWHIPLTACPAKYRFAFSATPVTDSVLSNFLIMSVCGPIIFSRVLGDAFKDETLATPLIKFILRPFVNPKLIRMGYEGRDAFDQEIIYNDYANKMIASIIKHHIDKKDRILVFAKEIKLGEHIQSAVLCVPEYKNHILFLNSKIKQGLDVLNRLNAGDLHCIIGTTLIDMGLDIPEVNCLIMACAGDSSTRTIQRIGRGTRRTAEKDTFIVYDILDASTRNMLNQSLTRIKTYQAEKIPIDQESLLLCLTQIKKLWKR